MSEDKIIRVDMTDQSISIDPFPDEWSRLGGRALSAKILNAECDPACDPLGPDNLLVLAPGLLAGSAAPTSGRMSVGGKSPLTGGIKEANAGGNPAQDMMKLGYRAIIVRGAPSDSEKRYALDVDAEGVRIKEVPDCKGLWNYALIDQLSKSYSNKASFVSIGPAGELKLKGASVACTDQEKARHPARHAARGGLGAVMGAKGLKYVSIEPGRSRARQGARRKEFMARCKSSTKAYLDGPQPMQYGTSTSVGMANMMFTFPYKNRVEGQSPDAETLDGKGILASFEERGGGMHNCLTGCIVQCSNLVHDADGNYKTSALEFETLTLLGSNCAVQTWDEVAELDRLCDELGLDTIETGAALGILMDSGGMDWGDSKAMLELMKSMASGDKKGLMIGDGADETGRQTGHHRIPTVRGQSIPAWDPRPLKATGVSYATSAMGADHTAGLVVNPGMAEADMPKASQESQIINAVVDSSGFCMFLMLNLDQIRGFLGDFVGEDISREEIIALGWECLQDEWKFNDAAGHDKANDDLPQCMKEDKIGPQEVVFDVSQETIQQVRAKLLAEPTDAFCGSGSIA